MTPRFVVTCLLCVWVFSITAPALLHMAMDENSVLISLSCGEEEPGEGEKKDYAEENLALPVSWNIPLGRALAKRSLPLNNAGSHQEIISEIVLPPPEGLAISQTGIPSNQV